MSQLTSISNKTFALLIVHTCISNSININRRQYEKKIVAWLWLMLSALSIRSKFFTFSPQKSKAAAVICTSIPLLIHDRYLVLPRRCWQMSGLSRVFGMKNWSTWSKLIRVPIFLRQIPHGLSYWARSL